MSKAAYGVSRIGRLKQTLLAGKALSEREIENRFKLKNPRAAISTLRKRDGLDILTQEPTRKNGVVKYQMA